MISIMSTSAMLGTCAGCIVVRGYFSRYVYFLGILASLSCIVVTNCFEQKTILKGRDIMSKQSSFSYF